MNILRNCFVGTVCFVSAASAATNNTQIKMQFGSVGKNGDTAMVVAPGRGADGSGYQRQFGVLTTGNTARLQSLGDSARRSPGAIFSLTANAGSNGIVSATSDSDPIYTGTATCPRTGMANTAKCTNTASQTERVFYFQAPSSGSCPALNSGSWTWASVSPGNYLGGFAGPGSIICCIFTDEAAGATAPDQVAAQPQYQTSVTCS